ncbi:MAG: tyrosine-protein phosphatase [Kordiimonadaceae bacterium]|nr:tyrosine-protein phosphatase [Kordiimonadaceae bacterium]
MTIHRRINSLTGVKNFRDMGGYEAADGAVIKWGRIIRSGHLHDLTEECGMEMLARDIETVIDFRSDREKERHPVHWPNNWIPDYHSISIGGNAAAWIKELYENLTKTDFPARDLHDQFLLAFRTIPIANVGGLKAFFDTIIDEHKGNAFLFHCTAGKDRTGIAGALLMKALGVADEQIMADFLLTNKAVDIETTSLATAEWLSKKAGRAIGAKDVLPLVGVAPDFLEEAYASIRAEYGSIDSYLETGLGLTSGRKEQLRNFFLK